MRSYLMRDFEEGIVCYKCLIWYYCKDMSK